MAATHDLRVAKEAAEASSRAQSQALNSVSMQIRPSLVSLLEACEKLAASSFGRLSPADIDALDAIRNLSRATMRALDELSAAPLASAPEDSQLVERKRRPSGPERVKA